MGSFKQHITCSTITGVCLGGIVYQFGFSVPVCLLSAGLCSIAGMLPDIDSDSSRSFQECIYFAAGLCAVLIVDRLRLFDIERDTVLLSGAAMFMFVRFGIGSMIKHITSHRGMFHSIPAAFFAGQIVFFLSSGGIEERLCKSSALVAGYLSHLILDEICSIDSTGQSLRLKKSFGTALKFYDPKKLGASLTLYAVIIGLTAFAVKNPYSFDGSESLETRIRLAFADSPLKQQDIASLISFMKKNMPQKDGTKNTEPETIAETAAVPVAKKTPATVQEQMEEELIIQPLVQSNLQNRGRETADIPKSYDFGSEFGSDAVSEDNRKNADYQMFARIDNQNRTPEIVELQPQIALLPFAVSQPQDTVVLPFAIPSSNTVNTSPLLPFSLPF